MNDKLIVAAAGSGKTTFLVKEALRLPKAKILLTTYTEANEAEIKKKIIAENKFIPENITVKTWFSFLIEHGVKPFQGVLYKKEIKGMLLVNGISGIRYINKFGVPVCYKEEDDFERHYFTPNQKIYSDKISKFVVRCNEKSNGAVIDRLSRIFTHVFVDEVQDLAGYDLELLKSIFSSKICTLLVGDPRQGTYSTSNVQKNKKYQKSRILNFFEDKSIKIETDQVTLLINHRCVEPICSLSNKLFPSLPQTSSDNFEDNEHKGVFFIKTSDVESYLKIYSPVQLRWDKKVPVNNGYRVMNFGETKGLTFERVLIYPPKTFIEWLLNNQVEISPTSRAKYYVALTRARFSVAILYDYDEGVILSGIENFTN